MGIIQLNTMSIETSKNTLKSSNSVPNEIYGQIGNPYDDKLMDNQKLRVNNGVLGLVTG